MKVPITRHRLENPYNAPPPIAITGNRLTPLRLCERAFGTNDLFNSVKWTYIGVAWVGNPGKPSNP